MNSTIKTTFVFAAVLAAMPATTAVSTFAKETQQADSSQVTATRQADAGVANETSVKSFSGRLPRYYASLVDNQQRAAIYAIQMRFYREIESLERQLAALKKTEMEEIESVLTAAQRKQLEELRLPGARLESAEVAEEPTPEPEVEQTGPPMPAKSTKQTGNNGSMKG
jgi:hypothetical protein